MDKKELISADEICLYYQVEYSFLNMLQEHDLIRCSVIEQVTYFPLDLLPLLERLIRLHYDLEINVEGLEAVNHLLEQMEEMQHTIRRLENRLQGYEEAG